MNSVNIIGRIRDELIIKYTQEQVAVVDFILIYNRPYSHIEEIERKRQGKRTIDAFRIVVYGKKAEDLYKYMKKGGKVGVTGMLRTGDYGKDGKKKTHTEIVTTHIEFLGNPKRKTEYKDLTDDPTTK